MVENIGNREYGITRDGDLAVVHTIQGTHQILYENHLFPADPNLFKEVPSGIFVESGLHRYSQYTHDTQFAENHPVWSYAQMHGIALFYHDVALRKKGSLFVLGEHVMTGVLNAGGMVSLIDIANYIHETGLEHVESTKLAYMALATMWVATSTLSPFIKGEVRKKVLKLHPEQFLLTARLRNALMAYKQMWLMQESGVKQNCGVLLGRGHMEIEDDLQRGIDRTLAYLSRYKRLLRFASHEEELYSIVRTDFNRQTNRWEITERIVVPQLAELFSDGKPSGSGSWGQTYESADGERQNIG